VNDIVERIRSLGYVHVPVASQLFEEAASEIERLRQVVERKNLTDDERKAVEAGLVVMAGTDGRRVVETLRGLLERL